MPELTLALKAGVRERYDEPQRGYHDGRHLSEVLAAIDQLAADAPAVGAADLDVVRAAAWYHDAVYDPQADAGVNERASAALADAELTAASWPEPLVRRVSELVLMTVSHVADDPAGQLLADADLAILGSSPERYAEYAADVRREYAHVPDADFARGRSAILRAFLTREQIYATPQARRRWEGRARTNVAAEVARLTG